MSAGTAPSVSPQNAKKRRGKGEAAAVAAPVSVAASNTDAPSVSGEGAAANGQHEPSFLKELQKYAPYYPSKRQEKRRCLILTLLN